MRFVSGVLAVAGCGLVAAAASAAGPIDLYNGGDKHESVGQGDPKTPLRRGITYTASAFPLALRFGAPDDRWGGVQYESGRFRFVQLHHSRTGNVPLHGVGYITIEAANGPTTSPARTVQRLHATPKIDAGPVTAASLAGFAGKAFDATIVGRDGPTVPGISLAPFTTNHHCRFCEETMHGETLDVKYAGDGLLFRIIVLGVRGKTVVIYIKSDYANQPRFPPTKTFPTFLPYAQKMLATLTFPR